MKTVAASSGDAIIKRNLEVVAAKKPVECRPGFVSPAPVSGYAIGLQTRRHRTCGLQRLLVEASLFTSLAIETLRPDRHKVAVGLATLSFHKPIHGVESGGDHAIIRASRTSKQHGLGQSCVSVSQNVLTPLPIRTPDRLIHGKQSPRQHRPDLLCIPVAGIRIEIGLNSEQRVGAGTRTVKLHNCWQRGLE